MNIQRIQQKSRAFTLIEMLVVIAIMGILAALITWGARRASEGRAIKKTKAELIFLQAAIDDYQAKLGFYPPDNANDATKPPLFYELTGTKLEGGVYKNLHGDEQIALTTIQSIFNLGGFANSNPESVKNFLPGLKPQHYREVEEAPLDVEFLVVGSPGPNDFPAPSQSSNKNPINTWRYVSTNPTNNSGSYDLWAEIVVGGQTNVIGNWK
jgi:prepilin-type N-terminal cleavage/methylation domain-containing protein